MNQPPKTNKRIVSKKEYVGYVVRRIGFYLTAWSVGAAIAFCSRYVVYMSLPPHKVDLRESLVWACCFTPLMMCSAALCRRIDGRPEPGPQLHSSLIDLSAPASLVRASEEPSHEHESMLLRAAAESAQTPPEQLVRAVER